MRNEANGGAGPGHGGTALRGLDRPLNELSHGPRSANKGARPKRNRENENTKQIQVEHDGQKLTLVRAWRYFQPTKPNQMPDAIQLEAEEIAVRRLVAMHSSHFQVLFREAVTEIVNEHYAGHRKQA